MLEFGNAAQIEELKEKEQGDAIDEQIEALQTALYCKNNLSEEHARVLACLDGTTTEDIDYIIEEVKEALDSAASSLKKI